MFVSLRLICHMLTTKVFSLLLLFSVNFFSSTWSNFFHGHFLPHNFEGGTWDNMNCVLYWIYDRGELLFTFDCIHEFFISRFDWRQFESGKMEKTNCPVIRHGLLFNQLFIVDVFFGEKKNFPVVNRAE